MLKRKLQIFVSSTFSDLKEERQAAVAAILKTGNIPAGMELFIAGGETQWDTIKRWIDESDIYMLILGGRYGATHPETGIAYTEMEYDYAGQTGKPFFAVVISEATLAERKLSRGDTEVETENPAKLAKFRAKVLSKISTFFSDTKDVRLAVHEVVPILEQKHELPGWISGREFYDNKPLLAELSKLTQANAALQKELDAIRERETTRPQDATEAEFSDIREALANSRFDLSKIRTEVPGNPESMSGLDIFFNSRAEIVRGAISNIIGSTNWQSFRFYHVFPALAIHDLVALAQYENHPKAQKYILSDRGKKFLVYYEKKRALEKSAPRGKLSSN